METEEKMENLFIRSWVMSDDGAKQDERALSFNELRAEETC